MNSNFRVFWLAPVTRNILCYSLFCDQANMASRFGTLYKDEISYKQTPRKRRTLACQCSLVGRKLFSCWICNNMIARWLNIRGLHTLSLIFWQRPRISWQQCKLMFTQTIFLIYCICFFRVWNTWWNVNVLDRTSTWDMCAMVLSFNYFHQSIQSINNLFTHVNA